MLVAGPLDVFVLASTGMFWKLRWNHGIDPLALEDAQVRGLHEVPHDVLADGDQGGHQTTPRRKPSWWWYLHLTATCSESALHKTLEDAKVLGEHILDGDLSKHVVVKILPKLHVDLVHEKNPKYRSQDDHEREEVVWKLRYSENEPCWLAC